MILHKSKKNYFKAIFNAVLSELPLVQAALEWSLATPCGKMGPCVSIALVKLLCVLHVHF